MRKASHWQWEIEDIGSEAANYIERLREVVMLLVAYDEHDEEIQKGAVMWDVLIEAAHAALKGSGDV